MINKDIYLIKKDWLIDDWWWIIDKNRDCELKWDSGRVRGFNHRTCRFRHQTRGENRKWLVLDGETGWLDNYVLIGVMKYSNLIQEWVTLTHLWQMKVVSDQWGGFAALTLWIKLLNYSGLSHKRHTVLLEWGQPTRWVVYCTIIYHRRVPEPPRISKVGSWWKLLAQNSNKWPLHNLEALNSSVSYGFPFLIGLSKYPNFCWFLSPMNTFVISPSHCSFSYK